mmetsp:Transcript_22836/g.52875  ORF Transcript_22836/g.52875 Transcript_22836/m.52875 type:complete len:91 (+) Transcript_22836:39-311(+)
MIYEAWNGGPESPKSSTFVCPCPWDTQAITLAGNYVQLNLTRRNYQELESNRHCPYLDEVGKATAYAQSSKRNDHTTRVVNVAGNHFAFV